MQADQVGASTFKKPEFIEIIRGNTHNGIYGLGQWREELNEQGDAVLISSPSWAGAAPDRFSGFYSSPILAMMVRQAVKTPDEFL